MPKKKLKKKLEKQKYKYNSNLIYICSKERQFKPLVIGIPSIKGTNPQFHTGNYWGFVLDDK